MRHSFLLHLEFGGDLRGKAVGLKTKRLISTQIKEIAGQQDMHAFSYDEDSSGQYAFFAHPDLVDERTDLYEVGVLREVLRVWLRDHPDIMSFELGEMTDLNAITPKAANSNATDSKTAKQDKALPKHEDVVPNVILISKASL